jgi:hypothetical protein
LIQASLLYKDRLASSLYFNSATLLRATELLFQKAKLTIPSFTMTLSHLYSLAQSCISFLSSQGYIMNACVFSNEKLISTGLVFSLVSVAWFVPASFPQNMLNNNIIRITPPTIGTR